MENPSFRSTEEITSFILQQLDQKLTSLEERTHNQRLSLKNIKKNRKLAEVITRPYFKVTTNEESEPEKALHLEVRDYIRDNYPEPYGYMNDEDDEITDESPVKNFRAASPLDVTQMASKSILDMLGDFQGSPGSDNRRNRSQGRVRPSFLSVKSGEFTSNLIRSGSLAGLQEGEKEKYSLFRKGSMNDNDYNLKDLSATKPEQPVKWDTSKKDLELAKKVLLSFKAKSNDMSIN